MERFLPAPWVSLLGVAPSSIASSVTEILRENISGFVPHIPKYLAQLVLLVIFTYYFFTEAGCKPAWAVTGDFAFIAAGHLGLLEAAQRNIPLKVMVLYNGKSETTGGQRIPDGTLERNQGL